MGELNESEQLLKQLLEERRDLYIKAGMMEGWHYRGIEDFILRHGVWYRPNGRPPRQGAHKQCFGNSIVNSAVWKVPYIEGMALSGTHNVINGVKVPSPNPLMAIHHAWNLDDQGDLCDTTWMNIGLAYIGVEFSLGRADNATWFDDACVLDNPGNGFKLLKQPWIGENYDLRWRKSKALRELLRRIG